MTKIGQFIESHLVPPLIHGDEQHQLWLKDELRKWIPELEELFEDALDFDLSEE